MNSDALEDARSRNVEQRREFIRRWARYIRTHDDAVWSEQQNTLIDAQLESANEMARNGQTDPVEFVSRIDRLKNR